MTVKKIKTVSTEITHQKPVWLNNRKYRGQIRVERPDRIKRENTVDDERDVLDLVGNREALVVWMEQKEKGHEMTRTYFKRQESSVLNKLK